MCKLRDTWYDTFVWLAYSIPGISIQYKYGVCEPRARTIWFQFHRLSGRSAVGWTLSVRTYVRTRDTYMIVNINDTYIASKSSKCTLFLLFTITLTSPGWGIPYQVYMYDIPGAVPVLPGYQVPGARYVLSVDVPSIGRLTLVTNYVRKRGTSTRDTRPTYDTLANKNVDVTY